MYGRIPTTLFTTSLTLALGALLLPGCATQREVRPAARQISFFQVPFT